MLTRRLDVMPATVAKFRTNGDAETADLLENVIYQARAAGPLAPAPSALSCRAACSSARGGCEEGGSSGSGQQPHAARNLLFICRIKCKV